MGPEGADGTKPVDDGPEGADGTKPVDDGPEGADGKKPVDVSPKSADRKRGVAGDGPEGRREVFSSKTMDIQEQKDIRKRRKKTDELVKNKLGGQGSVSVGAITRQQSKRASMMINSMDNIDAGARVVDIEDPTVEQQVEIDATMKARTEELRMENTTSGASKTGVNGSADVGEIDIDRGGAGVRIQGTSQSEGRMKVTNGQKDALSETMELQEPEGTEIIDKVKATIQVLETAQENEKWYTNEFNVVQIIDVFVSLVQSSLDYGVDATHGAVVAEVMQMVTKGVFGFMTPQEWKDLNAEKFQQLLPCTLILKGKYTADNEFQKVKARLVVLGNLQRTKFEEVFLKSSNESPTVSLVGLFSVLVLAAKRKQKIASFDVAGAFLHADLKDRVYMKLSKQIAAILMASDPDQYRKFLQPDSSMIVALQKCLYGLREAPRKWYELVKTVITEKMGFTQSEIDTCVFYKKNSDGSEVLVALFVDDMLVVGSDENISVFEEQLKHNFGDITSYKGDEIDFLGMRISRDPMTGDVSAKQQGYIESIVEQEHTREGKEEASPHYSNFTADKARSDLSGKSSKAEYFRRKVMQLMYLAVRTRPDILFDVAILSARCDNPSNHDLKSLDRILRFTYQTRSSGLRFRSKGKLTYNASVDASFNCYETGKGHSGFCLFPDLVGSAAILCKSLKQKQVTKSSTESELVALKEAVQHILICAELMMEIDKSSELFPIVIHQDNASAIRLINQPVVNRQGRSKFINRALFQVNENVEKGEIIVVHKNTDELVADFFTKAVHGQRYTSFRAKIMGLDGASVSEVHLGDTIGEAMGSILELKNSEGNSKIVLDDLLVSLTLIYEESE